MNLTRLFETQDILDKRIVKEKGLEGQDLLPMKILALQVELGELANEWRGFKFWSKDQEPRTFKSVYSYLCKECGPQRSVDCQKCGSENRLNEYNGNPLLEEYVDCLHFILSIGLELGIDAEQKFEDYVTPSITTQFAIIFYDIANLSRSEFDKWDREYVLELFDELCVGFIGLGHMLGFTWEQIEQAYYAKNKINHVRQATGY